MRIATRSIKMVLPSAELDVYGRPTKTVSKMYTGTVTSNWEKTSKLAETLGQVDSSLVGVINANTVIFEIKNYFGGLNDINTYKIEYGGRTFKARHQVYDDRQRTLTILAVAESTNVRN